ncbi:LysR family transcriptional regulator [Chromohalobacter canadensis]|uniref:LysR family transcriptional regulator n=1 Tax=Chromohalobacter canadensis TaxID=141389 RepID=UPI0024103C79|nr:LysR family transcriptional regulator [Chromohalobacter canadensis]
MSHDTVSPGLSLREIRAILAVAEQRGFSSAARRLNISQSSLSRTIHRAESVLAIRLFQRGWGGAEPTPEGEIVRQHCTQVMAELLHERDALMAAGLTRLPLPLDLRWRDLACVAAVVHTGKTTTAAKWLRTSQSSVSRTLGAISVRLGSPLFQRSGEGLRAELLAERLVALRDRMCARMQPLQERLGHLAGEVTGRLAVGMTPFCEQERVAQAFGDLLVAYPQLRLSAVTGSYVMLTDALRRGEIDLVVGLLRELGEDDELAELPLAEEAITVLARSDHPCAVRSVSMEELARQTWIVAPAGTPIRAYFERLFLGMGKTPPVQTCEIVTFHLAESMVRESQSLALLLYSPRKVRELPPGLVRVPVTLPDNRRHIGVTYRRDAGLSFTQRQFIDGLAKRFADGDAEGNAP